MSLREPEATLENQRVLVLGASSDIGVAFARLAAARGAYLALQGRDSERLAHAAAAAPGRSSVHPLKFTSASDLSAHLENIAVNTGRPSHLVVLLGYHRLVPFRGNFERELQRHLEVNTTIALSAAKAFANSRVSNDQGPRSITFCSSIAHRVGEAGLVAYAAAKGALVAAARSMAVELSRRNMRVNTVSPGWLTGRSAREVEHRLSRERLAQIAAQYPLGLGTPQDAAHAILFLCSPAARWITGIDLVVDGGRSCV